MYPLILIYAIAFSFGSVSSGLITRKGGKKAKGSLCKGKGVRSCFLPAQQKARPDPLFAYSFIPYSETPYSECMIKRFPVISKASMVPVEFQS
jgi:hypothetical protein